MIRSSHRLSCRSSPCISRSWDHLCWLCSPSSDLHAPFGRRALGRSNIGWSIRCSYIVYIHRHSWQLLSSKEHHGRKANTRYNLDQQCCAHTCILFSSYRPVQWMRCTQKRDRCTCILHQQLHRLWRRSTNVTLVRHQKLLHRRCLTDQG